MRVERARVYVSCGLLVNLSLCFFTSWSGRVRAGGQGRAQDRRRRQSQDTNTSRNQSTRAALYKTGTRGLRAGLRRGVERSRGISFGDSVARLTWVFLTDFSLGLMGFSDRFLCLWHSHTDFSFGWGLGAERRRRLSLDCCGGSGRPSLNLGGWIGEVTR